MERKDLIFAIDVDGVLRDNLGEMVNVYNKEFNDNKKIEDVTSYKTEISFPRILEKTGTTASHWFFQEHSQELFVDAKPFEHIVSDIETLKRYGKVIIITYQKTYLNKMQTLEWLEKNGVEPDGIVFLKDKTLLECDYLIDDNDWNFIGTKAKNAILINAPYNKDVDIISVMSTSEDLRYMAKYDSLHEFVKNFTYENRRSRK